ncbi:MAG TPA: hypothetical protein VJ258_05075, partial [Candidatus Limnocylindrales bacterium]|nr:hypothetical protein [Candidatus Limnocylindrales bacterium]
MSAASICHQVLASSLFPFSSKEQAFFGSYDDGFITARFQQLLGVLFGTMKLNGHHHPGGSECRCWVISRPRL